ncbi:MAG: carboxymuconolactone decarboxylase family protein [Rhodobacteraceae bacterium]|nr:carboxymuconolactone decarboxylase family protein [Paracoccaceae bacterium]
MSLIPIVTDEDANPEQAALFAGCTKMLGRVANALRVASHAPKITQALLGFMIPALREEVTGALSVRIKALAILKTSMLNGCAYCIGHNTSLGRAVGFSDEQILAIEGDYNNSALFTDAEKAAIAWAECLTEKTYRQNPQVMDELKTHFSNEQIVEITMVSGFFNFWNRFTDGLQVDLEAKEQVSLIRKSKKVDVNDYITYMQGTWWNDARPMMDESAVSSGS